MAALTTTAHSVTMTAMGSKVWVSLSQITFQPLREEIAKYYCIASSFHNMFDLMHNKVLDEANTYTSKSHKITRCTMFSWTCFEKHRLLCTRKPNFSSPEIINWSDIVNSNKRNKNRKIYYNNFALLKIETIVDVKCQEQPSRGVLNIFIEIFGKLNRFLFTGTDLIISKDFSFGSLIWTSPY